MALLAFALTASACTDVDLEPIPTPPPVRDDKASIGGTLCTGTPESREFPLRVLFLVDGSPSMGGNGQPGADPDDPFTGITGREFAMREAWTEILDVDPTAARIGITRFASEAQPLTPVDDDMDGLVDSYFTNDRSRLDTATAQAADTSNRTNYVNALTEAYFELRTEFQNASLESLPLSRYIVIFLSDGVPDDNGDVEQSSEENIIAGVQAMSELADRFRVGSFEFHTVYLATTLDQDSQRILQIMAEAGGGTFRSFPSGESLNFLDIGLSAFRRVFTLQSLAVFNEQVVVDSKQTETIAMRDDLPPESFIDVSGDGLAGCGEGFVDTDGDGLVDLIEDEIGTDPLVPDTDDDGLRDRVEYSLTGLDPLDPMDSRCFVPDACRDMDMDGACDCIVDLELDGVCDCVDDDSCVGEVLLADMVTMKPVDCIDADMDGLCDCPDADMDGRCDYEDRDGDGLVDCEEVFFGTAQNGGDTDADGLPDPLEIRALSNPGEEDRLSDTDLDGLTNGREALSATDLACDDAAIRSRVAYRYQIEEKGLMGGSTCYDFQIDNITLAPTRDNYLEVFPGNGWNRIMIYAGEVAFDDPDSFAAYRVACVMAAYRLDRDQRYSAASRFNLTDADFVNVRDFDAETDCIWPR